MRVFELMSATTVAVAADATLRAAMERMERELFRHLPVLDRGRLVGVLSERDVLEETGRRPHGFDDAAEGRAKVVRDCMQPSVETAAPGDSVAEAAARLVEHGIGCLPVVEAGELVGVLTEHDLLRAYVRSFEGADAPRSEDSRLAEVMATELVVAQTSTSVAEALELCHANGVRHLPVMHEGWLVGLVSDRDLRMRMGRGEHAKPLEAAMTRELAQLPPHERLSAAAREMLARRIGSVLVTDAGRLVGVVTSSDVARRFAAGHV